MKRSLILCVVFMFVALFSASVSAQDNSGQSPKPKADEPKKEEASPLLADWDVVIAAPGQDLAGTLKLEKDSEHFKGSVTTDLGEAPLHNIKISGDAFTADITVNAQSQTMEGTISGKLKEGKLNGEVNLPGLGAIPYSGKKH